MDNPAQADTATAGTQGGAEITSQQDVLDFIENASEEQLHVLLEEGSVELPVPPGGEKKGELKPKVEKEKVEPVAEAEVVEDDPNEEETPVVESEEETPEVEAEAVEEEPAAEEEEEVRAEAGKKTEPEEEEATEIKAIQRPRLKNPIDQQIAAVFKAAENTDKPISWAEAERRVKGDPEPPKKEEAAPEKVVVTDFQTVVTTLTEEVDGIKAKLTELGANEGLVTPEITKLNIDLTEKVSDLKLAKRDLTQAQARQERETKEIQATSETARQKSYAEAVEAWPDAADKSKPLGKAVAQRILEMRNPKHPDHALLYADSCALRVTKDVAGELGIAPKEKAKAKSTSSTAKAKAPPETKIAAPQVSGGKTAVRPVKPAGDSKQALGELLDKGSLADLDAVQGGGGDIESLLLAGV